MGSTSYRVLKEIKNSVIKYGVKQVGKQKVTCKGNKGGKTDSTHSNNTCNQIILNKCMN